MAKPEPDEECIIELNKVLVSSVTKKTDDAYKRRRVGEPTIFRIPQVIRELEPNAYEPEIISLGPYHRCKPHLQAMNELKLEYFSRLVCRNPVVVLDTYISMLRTLEKQARSSYSEDIDMNSNEFVEMMLLDGCFVVEWLLRYGQMDVAEADDKVTNEEAYPSEAEEEYPSEVDEGTNEEEYPSEADDKGTNEEEYRHPVLERQWPLHRISYDMLKLENQLPFFVLESIFGLATVPNERESLSLEHLAFNFFKGKLGGMRMPLKDSVPRFHHFVHLLQSCITPAPAPAPAPASAQRQKKNLQVESYNPLRCFRSSSREGPSYTKAPESIPCAKQLDEAGVKFRTIGEDTGFLNITFVDGVLSIPTLRIYDATKSYLRNLIAFEQCFPDAGTHVTAYADFMDSIIDKPMDVVLLRQKGVIENHLGSDEGVSVLFNSLCKEVLINSDKGYLSSVFKDVKRHCASRWNRHRRTLMHDYFSNPWSSLSLVAAVILLFFAAVQAVFAVLSYIKMPN